MSVCEEQACPSRFNIHKDRPCLYQLTSSQDKQGRITRTTETLPGGVTRHDGR